MVHDVKEPWGNGCHQPRCYLGYDYIFYVCCCFIILLFYFILVLVLVTYQHLIPYMWQLVFANIPIEGWIIDSNQHGFFDVSGHALVFPAHYAEGI